MKDSIKKTLAMYLKSAWKHKFPFVAAHVAVVLVNIVVVLNPLYLKALFDALSEGAGNLVAVGKAFYIVKIIIVLGLLDWALWRTVNFCAVYFQAKAKEDLLNICFKYLHKRSHGYFINNFSGALVKKAEHFPRSFEGLSDIVLYVFLSLAVFVAGSTYVLFRTNIWLGAGILLWIVVFVAVNLLFIKYKFRYDLEKAETETALTGLLSDTIVNHNNVKLFNGYDVESKKYAAQAHLFQKMWLFTQNLGELFFGFQAFLIVVLEAGLYLYTVNLWSRGLFTIGGFALIQMYVVRTVGMIWGIGKQVQSFYEKLADAEGMTALLNTPHEIQDVPNAKDLVVHEGAVQFKDVCFNYNETRVVLKRFNLNIAPKESVALIGPSGAGKTTIVKLLFRMYDATAGEILVDGQNIAKVTQESLWRNASLVPQDPILSHRSLMENIRYGKQNATDEEVIQAAKLARCHDFIIEAPQGYDTFVGERGIKLSGGERQRVAIARAILKNAPILVLDEATSSLDSESERLIQDALSDLIKDKTVIVIAHRLSTVKKMDRIVVVENGGIVEEGTHDSLLDSKSGIYAKLWEIQAGGFVK